MPFDEWEVFVSNEVAKKFQLKAKDIKTTVDEIAKEKHNENKNVVSNPTGEEQKEKTDAEKRLSNSPENIQNSAYKILEEGDTFKFILDTWNLRHVGDMNIGENCLCAVASTFILNTRGYMLNRVEKAEKAKVMQLKPC
jgi:hypothetical protein